MEDRRAAIAQSAPIACASCACTFQLFLWLAPRGGIILDQRPINVLPVGRGEGPGPGELGIRGIEGPGLSPDLAPPINSGITIAGTDEHLRPEWPLTRMCAK